jgi:hypothetical protein
MTDQIKDITDSPTIDEPVIDKPEVKTEIDVDGLVAQLKAVGVTNPEQLQKKLDASSQAGNLARLLGDSRKQNEELSNLLNELKSTGVKTKPKDDFDFDETSSGTIDIESVVMKAIRKEKAAEQAKFRQAQQAVMAKYNRIKHDPDYEHLRESWEKLERSPDFIYQVQMGQTDPVEQYTEMVRGFYKGLSKQAYELIEQLTGGKKQPPPHMETGERSPQNIVSETDKTDGQKKINELKKKLTLTEDEEMEALNAILG